MLISPAFIDLTTRQKLLYVYCKKQYYGKKKPIPENDLSFTFNQYKWCTEYQLYSKGNSKQFYKDMTALIMHGFISCVRCGATARQKNIYQYSSKWQCWPNIEITNDEMTESLLKKKYKKEL